MNTLIKNGRVIDPTNNHDDIQDIYICQDKILQLGGTVEGFVADRVIDATGRVIMPGFVDINTHLPELGYGQKANIKSEAKAAAAGGFTTICFQPDTKPTIDTSAVAQLVLDNAGSAGFAKVLPLGALTSALEGKTLTEMLSLNKVGCVAMSQVPCTHIDSQILRRALQYASTHNILVILKAEDFSIKDNGCVHEGAISASLGLPGIPSSAETVALAQMIELVEETNARIHVTGISSARAVAMLRRAQQANLPITADVHAYQLHLTEVDIGTFDPNFHTSPPLRSTSDKEALIEGVKAGVLFVSSGHSPVDFEAKQAPFPETETGISSIEIVLPLMLQFVDQGILTLHQVAERLSQNPANVLGLNTGHLSPQSPADISIINLDSTWLVTPDNWFSRGLNSPFFGHLMKGQLTHTLVNGRLVYEK